MSNSAEADRRFAIALEAAQNQARAQGVTFDLAAADRVRRAVVAELTDADLVAMVVRGLAGDRQAKEALAELLGRLGKVVAGLVVRVIDVETALGSVRVIEEPRLWSREGKGEGER